MILFHVKHRRSMAGQRKKNVSKLTKFRRRVGWRVGMAVVALIALSVGVTHFNSRILHVRYANVRLEDLPESFDGTKILFASDFDLCGLNTADDMDRLFRKLPLCICRSGRSRLHADRPSFSGNHASSAGCAFFPEQLSAPGRF